MKIALIVLCFWMGSAFASECTDEVKKNAFDRLSRDKNAENIKVGVKIKSYGTLVTWSLDTTHKVGSEIRDISMAGYLEYDKDCQLMKKGDGSTTGDGAIVSSPK